MQIVKSLIDDVLEEFNKTIKQEGFNYRVYVTAKCRKKKFYLNRKDFYEQDIAEMSLYQKGEPTLLLWRKEILMPGKVEGVHPSKVEAHFMRQLYFYLFFEAMGNFCNVLGRLITSEDYAEYDIDKDRMKAHSSGDGMVVKTLKAGEFFEKDNEFDVFMVTDKFYFVYTAHGIAAKNNGVWRIPLEDCMMVKMADVKILSLDQLKKGH